MTEDERPESLRFSDQLRQQLRAGRITVGSDETVETPIAKAINAYGEMQAAGATEAEFEAAHREVTKLIEASRPPVPDFGGGARPPQAQPADMNTILRTSAGRYVTRGFGVR